MAGQRGFYLETLPFSMEAMYHWNTDSAEWVGDSKSEYAFDGHGNKTLEIYLSWVTELKAGIH